MTVIPSLIFPQQDQSDLVRYPFEANAGMHQRQSRRDKFDAGDSVAHATNGSGSILRRSRDELPNDAADSQFRQSPDLFQHMCQCVQNVSPPYALHLSISSPESSRDERENHDLDRSERGHHAARPAFFERNGRKEHDQTQDGRARMTSTPFPPALGIYQKDTGLQLRKGLAERSIRSHCAQADALRITQSQERARHVGLPWRGMGDAPEALRKSLVTVEAQTLPEDQGHRRTSSLCYTTSDAVSGPFADGSRNNGSGSGTTISSSSNTTDDVIMEEDDSANSDIFVDSLPENARDLPLTPRTSAAIFLEAQLGLERLLLDLQYLEDDRIEDDRSTTSDSDSETPGEASEAEDTCDGQKYRPGSGGKEA